MLVYPRGSSLNIAAENDFADFNIYDEYEWYVDGVLNVSYRGKTLSNFLLRNPYYEFRVRARKGNLWTRMSNTLNISANRKTFACQPLMLVDLIHSIVWQIYRIRE